MIGAPSPSSPLTCSGFAEALPELAAQYAVPPIFAHDLFACLAYKREDYRRACAAVLPCRGWVLGRWSRRCVPHVMPSARPAAAAVDCCKA